MAPSFTALFTAGLACLASASAYTTPTGDAPKGNPISQPGLNTIVPVDESFTITWEPTTEGTVSLVLLKGPAENLIPVYAIAEKIENSGSYTWEPKSTLEASEGAKGYGIQLIDDKTGQYQYTTQFGISNDKKVESAPAGYAGASSSVVAPSSYAAAASTSAAAEHVSSATSPVVSSAPAVEEATTPAVSTTLATSAPVASAPYAISKNATVAQPTGAASPTGSNSNSTVPYEGGASMAAASFGGLVLAAGVAVFAL